MSGASGAKTRRASLGGREVAIVPIEYLLAESALCNDTPLTRRILHAMRNSGYDPGVLKAALQVLPSERASHLSRLAEFSLLG